MRTANNSLTAAGHLNFRSFLLALVAGLFSSATVAASISVTSHAELPLPIINIVGDIEVTDGDRFSAIAYQYPQAIVNLNSYGGNLLAGIQIGRIIRLRNFPTAVMDGNICASVCAVIWLAGTPRYADGTSRIGFHAAYNKKNGVKRESGAGNAVLGSFLGSLGLSDEAIAYFTSSPPDDIMWLHMSEADELGLKIQDISTIRARSIPTIQRPPFPTVESSSLEKTAKQFMQQYFAYWSTDDTRALQFMNSAYADTVFFYGKTTSKAQIVKEKLAMIKRWPARAYVERAGSLQAECGNITPMSCLVSGIVDWEVRSTARNAVNDGISQFKVVLDFASGRPQVVGENSETVARKEH